MNLRPLGYERNHDPHSNRFHRVSPCQIGGRHAPADAGVGHFGGRSRTEHGQPAGGGRMTLESMRAKGPRPPFSHRVEQAIQAFQTVSDSPESLSPLTPTSQVLQLPTVPCLRLRSRRPRQSLQRSPSQQSGRHTVLDLIAGTIVPALSANSKGATRPPSMRHRALSSPARRSSGRRRGSSRFRLSCHACQSLRDPSRP